MSLKKYVPDSRLMTAPRPPLDRPPTRQEVWDTNWHVYQGIKERDEIAAMSKAEWVATYVYWFNLKDWRKQPDWVEGDPVIPEAVPDGPLWWVEVFENTRTVYACLERAGRRAA